MDKRLQSLKIPRDLTLGGTKPNKTKKTFVPNLNAVRNKDKQKPQLLKKQEEKKRNQKRDFKNEKRFQNAKLDRFVQSSGIFSDGVGNDAIKKSRYERTPSVRDETSAGMTIPKVKKENTWQVSNKNETKVLEDLMGHSSINDEHEYSPFAPTTWNEHEFKKSFDVAKPEFKQAYAKLENARIKKRLTSVSEGFEDNDKYNDFTPNLTLWNLPDSFAGKGFSDDPKDKTIFDYKLPEMLEGKIGKMKVYGSGKIEVYFGNMKYDIEPAETESFPEKIASIDPNTRKTLIMGDVENTYVLSPNWMNLMGQ